MKNKLTHHTLCDVRPFCSSLPVPIAFNVPARLIAHFTIGGETLKGDALAYEHHGLYWFCCFYREYKPINSVGFVSRTNCLRALRTTVHAMGHSLVELKNDTLKSGGTKWVR